MKPDFVWAEACCRFFIENEVRTMEKDIERWLGNQLKKTGVYIYEIRVTWK